MTTTAQPALFAPDLATTSQPERTQYVFVYLCGCPRTVIEGSSVADAEEAWHEAAPLGAERHWLEVQGVRLLHVPHAEYVARFYALMRTGCPHPRQGR